MRRRRMCSMAEVGMFEIDTLAIGGTTKPLRVGMDRDEELTSVLPTARS
jgi:hypothetical protein